MAHGPALITLLTILLLLAVGFNVGRARGKYGIKAPATTGHADFERIFRVQMNTLENAVIFLPSMWLFSRYLEPQMAARWATILGAVWLLGRVMYALTYSRDAAARGPGFLISFVATLLLLAGAFYGVVGSMLV